MLEIILCFLEESYSWIKCRTSECKESEHQWHQDIPTSISYNEKWDGKRLKRIIKCINVYFNYWELNTSSRGQSSLWPLASPLFGDHINPSTIPVNLSILSPNMANSLRPLCPHIISSILHQGTHTIRISNVRDSISP